MKRILPKSMAGQLIAVLLLALVVAQVASLAILFDDRRLAFLVVTQQDVMSRTVSVEHRTERPSTPHKRYPRAHLSASSPSQGVPRPG